MKSATENVLNEGIMSVISPPFFVLEDEVACCLHVNMEYLHVIVRTLLRMLVM